MILVAVQIGEENDSRFVVVSGSLEDMPGQRKGWAKQSVVAIEVRRIESAQRQRSRRRDGVKDAQQGIAVSGLVAQDQFGVVEVVSRVHADSRRHLPPHFYFAAFVQQRDLHAVDMARIVADN